MSVVEMGPSDVRRTFIPDEGAAPRRRRDAAYAILHVDRLTDRDDCPADHRPALRRPRNRTIGLVTPGVLPYAFVTALKDQLGATSFVDITSDIDAIKAIKSARKYVLRRTARLQDEVFAEVLNELRPGLRDIDVTSIAQRQGQVLGSEQGIFLGGSSPLGIRSPFSFRVKCRTDA